MFNNGARDRKALWFTFGMFMRVTFIHAMAFLADEKFSEMTV